MRSESEIISREYEINKGMAVVVVSLSPSMGREPIVTVRTNDVRKWLEAKEDVRLGEAVPVSYTHLTLPTICSV